MTYLEKKFIINKIIKKNVMNGNNSNNHAILVCPDLQIRFNIQVQNKTYRILITNTVVMLGTSQLNVPIQNCLDPIF